MKNKKTKIAIIAVIALVLVTIGITYAYWLITRTQEGENVITTGCLDISLSGENDITLTDQFPMSDEDGMKLTPYTFTVTNNCNTSVDYYINLESIGDESAALNASSLKVALDDNITLLSDNYVESETRTEEAYASHRLGYGTLASKGSDGSSQSYNLRIWIDADAPISEMNKTFSSKISVTVGQGINNPIKEGTLAYNLVSQYGDINEVTEMDPNVKYESLVATGNKSFTASFTYSFGTDYEIDEESGKYTLAGDIVQARISQCRNGTKTCGKYTLLTQSTNTSPQLSLYEITDFQSTGNYVTANTYKYINVFDATINAGESAIHKTYDDLGTSYYFRGDVDNNYVQFGTAEFEELKTTYTFEYNDNGTWEIGTADTYEECEAARANYEETYDCNSNEEIVTVEKPLYWRIIRINGDGTVRMILDGNEKVANGNAKTTASIATTAFHSGSGDLKYFGYTYNDGSKEIDSNAKSLIDAWYEKNLKEKYGKYIADSIFCNDKTISRYLAEDENYNIVEVSASDEYIYIYFDSYERNVVSDNPTLKCANKSDRYTVDEEKGNGLLENPVGLITADEAKFVATNYLSTGASEYTMSACMWQESSAWMCGTGNNVLYTEDENAIRPVINLKADVAFEGDGSIETPYTIATN